MTAGCANLFEPSMSLEQIPTIHKWACSHALTFPPLFHFQQKIRKFTVSRLYSRMSKSSNSAGSGHSPVLSGSMRREREKAMSGVNTKDPSLPVDGNVAPWDRLPNETQINILNYISAAQSFATHGARLFGLTLLHSFGRPLSMTSG